VLATRRSTPSTAPAPTSARRRPPSSSTSQQLAPLFRERKSSTRPFASISHSRDRSAGARARARWQQKILLATTTEQARPGHREIEAIGGRLWPQFGLGQGQRRAKGRAGRGHDWPKARCATGAGLPPGTIKTKSVATYNWRARYLQAVPRDRFPIVRRRIQCASTMRRSLRPGD